MTTTIEKQVYAELIEKALKEPGTVSKCFSLFHDYSLFNTLYVGYQQMKRFGEITPIKGFRAWNDFNRKIKKGEKALGVLFPMFGYFPEKDENGEVVKDEKGKAKMVKYIRGFEEKHVHFAYSQTEILDKTKDEKQVESDLKGFDWELACKKLDIEVVPYNSIDGNCQGWCKGGRKVIAINPVAAHPVKTAVHEMAHAILHTTEKGQMIPRELKEVQAECTSYIVMTMLGDDEKTLSESRGYVQHWLRDNELTTELATAIMNAANKILEAGVDKPKKEYKRG